MVEVLMFASPSQDEVRLHSHQYLQTLTREQENSMSIYAGLLARKQGSAATTHALWSQ